MDQTMIALENYERKIMIMKENEDFYNKQKQNFLTLASDLKQAIEEKNYLQY